MKKLLLAFSAFTMAFAFTSCDKVSDKRFSTTIPIRIEVDAQTLNENGVEIDLSKIADVLAENADLDQVKDKIKSYELVQIKYKVYEYWNGPNTIFNGFIGFGDKNSTEAGVTKNLENFNLKESMDATEQSVMSFTSAENETIQKYFKDTNALKIFYKGDLNEVPATFKLYVQVDIDAIAEIEK
ncbi:MAG: hypothetical protein R2809_05760 [Flavobacteriales bacterium]